MPKGCHFIAISCQGIESAKVDHELIEAQLIQTAQISVLKRYAVFSGITNNRTQTNIIALTLGCSIKILRGFGRTLHRRSSLSSVKILGNRTIGSILFPSKKVRGLQWNDHAGDDDGLSWKIHLRPENCHFLGPRPPRSAASR